MECSVFCFKPIGSSTCSCLVFALVNLVELSITCHRGQDFRPSKACLQTDVAFLFGFMRPVLFGPRGTRDKLPLGAHVKKFLKVFSGCAPRNDWLRHSFLEELLGSLHSKRGEKKDPVAKNSNIESRIRTFKNVGRGRQPRA